MIDIVALKAELIATGEQARVMTNNATALAMSIRHFPEETIRALLDSKVGAGGLQEIVGLLRVQLSGALDRALQLVLDETLNQAQRFQQNKPNDPPERG